MLTAERLRELLHYDPDSGLFVWKMSTTNCVKVGDVAGWLRPDGYIEVKVDKKNYKVHRLVWLYMTGEFPVDQIDHINNNRSDNRWSNLRQATRQENNQNARKRKDNNSGFKGVYFDRQHNKWAAQIYILPLGNRRLGLFDSPEEAAAMYAGAALLFHGPFVHIDTVNIHLHFSGNPNGN